MRRWGSVPICKASRPSQKLGIWAHINLLRNERKEVIQGTEADLQEEEWRKQNPREKRVLFNSGVERKTEKKSRSGCKKPREGFSLQVDKQG
jgi:hypothetical protein